MNYNDLANLLYPNITKTIDDLEKMYPKRELPEGAEVTRFAPSPTGRMHLGNLYASFIPEVIAKQTNGVFIVRIEDTDQKRKIENGIELGINDLEHFNYKVDEHPIKGGNYGVNSAVEFNFYDGTIKGKWHALTEPVHLEEGASLYYSTETIDFLDYKVVYTVK